MNIRNFMKALACASLIFTVACDGDEETTDMNEALCAMNFLICIAYLAIVEEEK